MRVYVASSWRNLMYLMLTEIMDTPANICVCLDEVIEALR